MPFRFERIGSYEILVNEVGDYLITPNGTAQKIIERQIDIESELCKDLYSNFFISYKPIPSLIDNLATRYRTKKSFLDSFTALHIFVLTLRCNQSCTYCQASSKDCKQSQYDISFQNLTSAILLMFKSPSQSLTMEFQGGEPTLAFDKLKFAVEKAEKINQIEKKHITYVVCTNAINLTDEFLSFCKLYDIIISTSLDGEESLHNSNRAKEDSYSMVINGINRARNVLGHDKVSALMTTSNLSLSHPKEIIDSYRTNGFNNIFLRALNPYGLAKKNSWDYDYQNIFFEFYKTSLSYIIDINLAGEFFVEDFTALLLKKILTPFCIGFVDLQSPAGLINSVVVYNYDGYVYASDESRMLAEDNDYSFRLGHVTDRYSDIFFGEKTAQIAQIWANETLAGCSDCAFAAYCGADPVRNYSLQGDMYGYRPGSVFCRKHKMIISHIFTLMIERKEVMPVFKSWISKC